MAEVILYWKVRETSVMDGYELVRNLGESGIMIPVLKITAKDAFDDMRQGFMSRTDDYIEVGQRE